MLTQADDANHSSQLINAAGLQLFWQVTAGVRTHSHFDRGAAHLRRRVAERAALNALLTVRTAPSVPGNATPQHIAMPLATQREQHVSVDSAHVLQGRPELALPHLDVPRIAALRWDRLAACGYRGVVFDKDNTLTLPYQLAVHDSVAASLRECLAAFGENVVIFSNSAGAPPLARTPSRRRGRKPRLSWAHQLPR